MEWLSMKQWSPYVAGIGIGVLSWFTFLLSDKPLGCSTAFARTSGMIERLFRGTKVMERPYYKEFPPTVDWEWMLVVGIAIGAFLSAKLSGQFHLRWVPGAWAVTFGHEPVPRVIMAVVGGMVMEFGARWAGGCTSGHGISGALQLSVSSWLAAICFFIGGIATATSIFRILVG